MKANFIIFKMILLLSNYYHIKSYVTLKKPWYKIFKKCKNELAAKGLRNFKFFHLLIPFQRKRKIIKFIHCLKNYTLKEPCFVFLFFSFFCEFAFILNWFSVLKYLHIIVMSPLLWFKI